MRAWLNLRHNVSPRRDAFASGLGALGYQVADGTTMAPVPGDVLVTWNRINIGNAAALDCPLMVFDDYYLPGPAGELPDLTLYGANVVVDEYREAGATVELLPHRDRCDHGAWAVLAVVRR